MNSTICVSGARIGHGGADLGVRVASERRKGERRGDGWRGVASPSASLSTALGRIKVRPDQAASQLRSYIPRRRNGRRLMSLAAALCAVMNSPWAFVFRRRVLPFKRVECTFGAVPMHLPNSVRPPDALSARHTHTQYSGRKLARSLYGRARRRQRHLCLRERPRGQNGRPDPRPRQPFGDANCFRLLFHGAFIRVGPRMHAHALWHFI
jgi:hypothetical protein